MGLGGRERGFFVYDDLVAFDYMKGGKGEGKARK